MLILKKREAEEVVIVSLGDEGSISLRIRRPTYGELVESIGVASPVAYRLDRNVVGWDGVQDEKGVSIPFTKESFATLCEAYPAVMLEAAIACRRAYEGMSEIAAKN